jgi:quercetin dioxygenase-like cupin family protein
MSMLSVVGVQAEPLASVRAAPDELIWKPLGAGLQRANIIGDDKKSGIYVYRIRFPAGVRVKPHFHPDERVVTVISGTLLMGYGDKFDEAPMKPLPTGSIWTEPAKAPHYVWAKDGEVVIQVMGANGPSGMTQIEEK